MGSKTTTEQKQQQDSRTEPWAPAQPLLTGVLGKLGGISTNVTPGQQAGAAALTAGASGIPQLGPQAANVASGLLGSSASPQYRGMLGDALMSLKGNLNPFLTPGGAAGNPALRGYLDIARDDVADDIRGRFAAAGRDFSGAESGAIARGITAAEAPILANQYNADVERAMNAANTLYNATGGTVGALSGLDQQALGNQQAGLGAAGMLSDIYTAPGTAQLGAANAGWGLPLQNIQALLQAGIPIAALGTQSSGTMTGTQTKQSPWYTDALGLGFGGLGLLGQSGAFGKTGWLLSDERAKEDIRPIGMLFDETPVYSFRYKGDPSERTHVGLMAQDVESDRPDAVVKIGGDDGLRLVDYERATDRAAAIGMLAGAL